MSIEQFYHLQDKGRQTAAMDTQQYYLNYSPSFVRSDALLYLPNYGNTVAGASLTSSNHMGGQTTPEGR